MVVPFQVTHSTIKPSSECKNVYSLEMSCVSGAILCYLGRSSPWTRAKQQTPPGNIAGIVQKAATCHSQNMCQQPIMQARKK